MRLPNQPNTFPWHLSQLGFSTQLGGAHSYVIISSPPTLSSPTPSSPPTLSSPTPSLPYHSPPPSLPYHTLLPYSLTLSSHTPSLPSYTLLPYPLPSHTLLLFPLSWRHHASDTCHTPHTCKLFAVLCTRDFSTHSSMCTTAQLRVHVFGASLHFLQNGMSIEVTGPITPSLQGVSGLACYSCLYCIQKVHLTREPLSGGGGGGGGIRDS